MKSTKIKIDNISVLCQSGVMLKKLGSLLFKKAEANVNVSEVSTGVKHVSLTKFLKHRWMESEDDLMKIVNECNVSPDLGTLPPNLRRCLVDSNVAESVAQFRKLLNEFLEKKYDDILNVKNKKLYILRSIGKMFNTECALEVIKNMDDGIGIRCGLSGVVGKLIFPKLNQSYALKLFFPRNYQDAHGVWHEVANAFASYHAEPKNYNDVYMASVGKFPYILSAWGGDTVDFIALKRNKYSFFELSDCEMSYRNFRRGRIIDWGDLRQTDYGMAPYPVRKLFRTLIWAVEHNDMKTIQSICMQYHNAKKLPVRQKMGNVVELLFYEMLGGNIMAEVALDLVKNTIKQNCR